jgi:benzoate membrane transport protein
VASATVARQRLGRYLPPLSMAVPMLIFSAAALAIPLATARALQLAAPQVGAWILALYGLPALLTVLLTLRYRQPMLVAWHTHAVIALAALAGQVGYTDLLGATLVSGAVVLALGALGLTARLADLIPIPIVFAVVAGTLLPFVAGTFTALGGERLVIGGTLAAYLAARRFLGPRIPPVLPALLAGLALAALAGRLAPPVGGLALPAPTLARPTFAPGALAAVVPIIVPLVAFHSNLTWVAYLRGQGYRPPPRAVDVATGAGMLLTALVAPAPICMASALVPLAAGPEAGERAVRHWSGYATAAGFALLALGGALAAALPLGLLLAVAGLAMVGGLAQALGEVVRGPLRLGPLFAFVIASSKLALLGLGPLFWALVLGTAVSLLLEPAELRTLRAAGSSPT